MTDKIGSDRQAVKQDYGRNIPIALTTPSGPPSGRRGLGRTLTPQQGIVIEMIALPAPSLDYSRSL
jgi:hypothetical protein